LQDNAWVETACAIFHDDTGQLTEALAFKAGEDTAQVAWLMAHDAMQLFASHTLLLQRAAQHLNAHF